MTNVKILIVEDEHRLSDNIRDYLESQDYLCEQAFNFNDAKMMAGSYDYDCVLLDLMLPGGDGLDILREIRRSHSGEMADMMDSFDFIYSHIKNLKSKLARAGVTDCIKTVYGMGYKWME